VNADRPPDNSRQSWSERFRERNHVLLIFRDAVIALLVLIGLSGTTWALVFGIGIVAFFVGGPGWATLTLIPVYGVPALIVAYGVISLRIGAVLAPVAVAVIAWTGSAALRQEDQAAIEKFSIAALVPASRTHQVLALDGPDVTCDTACHRIIATSDTTLARKSRYSRDWVLFRRSDSCADEVQAISALEFLRDGHRDVCESRTTAKDIGTPWSCACDRCRSMSWMPLCRLASAASSMRSASASPAKSACWGAKSPAGWARRFRL
jgi:hypothetical protein